MSRTPRHTVKINWTQYDEATDEEVEREVDLPSKNELCARCNGNGSHVADGIDDNGITASEMAEMEPEEREGYFAGDYDVACEDCHGARIVSVPLCHDEIERDFPQFLADFDAWAAFEDEEADAARWDAESAAESAAERAFGC